MKAQTTWIVLANARIVRVLANKGPGKGLIAVSGRTWHAPEIKEYSDEPGQVQSSAGPGRASITRPDIQRQAEAAFAKDVATRLAGELADGSFSRLVVVGAPQMLGELRDAMSAGLRATVIGELDKDLTHTPLDELEPHLSKLIAV